MFRKTLPRGSVDPSPDLGGHSRRKLSIITLCCDKHPSWTSKMTKLSTHLPGQASNTRTSPKISVLFLFRSFHFGSWVLVQLVSSLYCSHCCLKTLPDHSCPPELGCGVSYLCLQRYLMKKARFLCGSNHLMLSTSHAMRLKHQHW